MRVEEKNGELVVTDFNALEAYKIACKIEEDGIHFYKKLKDSIKDKEAEQAIVFLLKEEERHLSHFNKELYEISEKEASAFEGDDLLSNIDYGIFWPYQDMTELDEILKDPKKALRLGVVIEEKSIKFYESCRERIADTAAKDAISDIIKEENWHKKTIEDILSRKK